MRITSVVLLGFCVGLVLSNMDMDLDGDLVEICDNVDLTIAIDNSNKVSNETFMEIKERVKKLIFDPSNGLPIRIAFYPSVSIHTFGEVVYEDEIDFSSNRSKLLEAIDNLSYHGNQNPRLDISLRHFQDQFNRTKRNKKIFVYIGNGETQYPDHLYERLNLLKAFPGVKVEILPFAPPGDQMSAQTQERLRSITTTEIGRFDYASVVGDDIHDLIECKYVFPDA